MTNVKTIDTNIAEIQLNIAVIIEKIDRINEKVENLIDSVESLNTRINSTAEVATNARILSLNLEKKLKQIESVTMRNDKIITEATAILVHWRWLVGTPLISTIISAIILIYEIAQR